MKNVSKRIFSLLLAFVMLLSVVPMTALATENEHDHELEVIAADDIIVATPDVATPDAEAEEAEELSFSFASLLAPTLLEGVTVDKDDVQIVNFENELNEVLVLNAEGDAVPLTEEQKAQLVGMFQQYVSYRNQNADVLGVQVPFFLDFNDNKDSLGQLGEALSLAGWSLDDVRAGKYTFDELNGMLVIFLYTDQLGVQFYGNAIKSARDEALQAVKDSGAQTEAQKLLVLNDWLAENVIFDMPYIMGEEKMKAEQPKQHQYYDRVYDVMYDMSEENIEATFRDMIDQGMRAALYKQFYTAVVQSMVKDGYLQGAAASDDIKAYAKMAYEQTVLEQITQAAYDEAYKAYATHEHDLEIAEDGWKWAADNSSATVSATCKTGLESYKDVAAVITSTCDATCTAAGKTTYIATAEVAGIVVTDTKEVAAEALGHNLVNGVCSREGCDYVEEEHKHDAQFVSTTAPTCTEDGYDLYKCACGYETRDPIAATGHKEVTKVATEATCTETGVSVITCENCDYAATDVIPVKDHSYDAGVETEEATCQVEGVMTFTCADCGATKTDVIAKKDHVDKEGAKDEAGNDIGDLVCDICGDTINIRDEAPALNAITPGTDADADRYAQAAIKAQETALAEQAATIAAAATDADLAPVINYIVYGDTEGDPNGAVETDVEKEAAAYADQFVTDNADALAADARAFLVEFLTQQVGADAAKTYMVDIDAQYDAFIKSAETEGIAMDPNYPNYKMTIAQIVDQQMDQPQQDPMLQKPDGSYMTPNEAIPVFADQAATESTVGVLQFWEGAHFGALGEGKAVCLGYSDAYSYLVQCMHPEYYTKSGNYKTASDWITDMDKLYYTNGNLDINKGYFTDFVRIHFQTDVTMFGVVEEGFNSDHFWNAAYVDGKWYYVDPCYTDVFVEVMSRDRAETDGNVDHMYFMFSHDSASSLYDGYYSELLTLYANAATDKSYEDSWTARIVSDTSYEDNYAYYVYSSRDLITLLDDYNNNQNGMTETDYNTEYEYKLVRHKLDNSDIGEGDSDYEALIEFNHPVETEGEEESDETVARVYNPSTKAMEENAFLTAMYAQHYADTRVYPSLAITCALNGDLLYFNLSNYLLAYDLTSGEIIVVKEYETVSAKRDKTNAFGAMAFSVVQSGGDLTVEDHPIAGIILKDDGNLYVSIATNYSFISGKETNDKTHATPDDPAAKGEYGYEYEESNYNPNYNSYGNDRYDNAQYEQYGYEQETNDNDEFMWTANFVEKQSMRNIAVSVCASHSYEAVAVDANCEHNAYTVNICSKCGAVENGTYAEVEETIHNHHYVYFAETYYTKDDNNNWNSGECYVCTECGFSIEEPSEPQKNDNVDEETYQQQVEEYEKQLAIWNNAVETVGHEYTINDATWAQDNTTVTFKKLTCDHCKARKSNLDCLLNDKTIETTLGKSMTVEASVVGYSGDCTEGAVATYAASGKPNDVGGSFYISKDVKLAAGNHAYEIEAIWNLVADEEGNAVLDENGVEQYTVDATLTCAICADTYTAEAVAATLDTENCVAPTCTETGANIYTATVTAKNDKGAEIGSATASLTVEVPAKGHNYEENVCVDCGAAALVIITQPKTTYTKMGEVGKTTVEVQGDGLTYKWYIKNDGQTKYSKSSITGPTYSCKMSEKAKNRRVTCIITDQYGNEIQTKTVLFREAASIVSEPKTAAYAKKGETAKITIEAAGDDLTYKWYLKNANSDQYTTSSITSATYSATMSEKVDGRRVRCVVKDKYGNTVESKTFVLRMTATITEQPESIAAKKGTTVEATVKAAGTDLTYQWYIKNKDSDKFVKSSVTEATYSVKMSNKVDGRQAYCKITDKYGNTVESEVITFTMK